MNTAQDLIDHLLTATGGGAQDGEHRAVRSAVVNGVREVMQTRPWLWHTRTGTFTTQQISTTATLTINSSTISVTSTTGFVVGRILVTSSNGFFAYTPRIVSVNSSTNQVVLDRAATASGTATVLVQTYYDLPANVKDIDSLMTETVGTLHFYVSPQEWMQLSVNTRGSGEPYYYTIMRSDTDTQRFQVRFVGVPQDGTVVHYTYRYIPAAIRLMGYEPSCRQGTATVSGNSATVTITGNTLPLGMDYSAIRFGTATTEADPVGSLNPYVYEREIRARGSNTQLTVDSVMPTTLTSVKYTISDIIDCSPQMWTAILSATEMWYARLAGKPAGDIVQLFNRDLRLAMENDVISPMSGRQYVSHYPTPRTMGYHSVPLNDVGG
jgi:hypothetical protein